MRAINATVMRQVNKRLILNQIRSRPISRAELAEETGLTRASVTQIVEELIGEGMVIETSVVGRSRLGRRSTQLAVNPRAGVIFSVNLGRDQCTVGATDLHGVVLRQNTELVPGRTPGEVLDAVTDTISRQLASLNSDITRVFGVGVSAPGPLNADTGTLLTPPRFEMWHNQPVASLLTQRTGLRVLLENPANAQALEQKYFGPLNDNFALIRLDDSLGVGVVVRGALYRGAPDFALELGQCICSDGRRFDEILSIPSLLAESGFRSWPELINHIDESCSVAAIDRLLSQLRCVVTSVACAYRVGSIVLGGSLGELLAPLLPALVTSVRAHLPADLPLNIRIADTLPVRAAAAPVYHTLFAAG